MSIPVKNLEYAPTPRKNLDIKNISMLGETACKRDIDSSRKIETLRDNRLPYLSENQPKTKLDKR